jgi:NAD(P)H-quinone oxidoreductase subunit 4
MLLLALMAAAGIPGLAGFPAELLVFEGSWTTFPRATLVCLLASGFTAVYAIRLFNRVGFGRLDNDRADWQATRWGERFPALALSLLVIATGVWPQALVGWSETATAALALRSGAPAARLASAQARSIGGGTLATFIATGGANAG